MADGNERDSFGLTAADWERLNAAMERAAQIEPWEDRENPVPVRRLDVRVSRGLFAGEKLGSWVSVRVAGDEKTRLGIYIGSLPTGDIHSGYHPGDQEISVFLSTNPAIFVPDLGRIVWGCESWWGVIDSPEKLRSIADIDIESIWYVQALRALARKEDSR